jgi:hypothetical protein
MKKRIAMISVLGAAWIATLIFTQFNIYGIFTQYLLVELLPGKGLAAVVVLGVLCLVAAGIMFAFRRTGIGFYILMLGMLLPLNVALWSVRDHARMTRMTELQQALEPLRQRGALPEDLRGTSLQRLTSGPFGMDRISYRKSDAHYTIDSYAVPLGPFILYSSDRADWYYEE